MQRRAALWFVISSLACGCAAGAAAPAAQASGSVAATTATTAATTVPSASTPQPSLNLLNAGSLAATPTTTAATPVTTAASSSGGLSTADTVIIAAVAVLLFGGIAFLVRRDAHYHLARAGHGDHEALYGQRAHPGSKAPRKPRKLTPAERKRRRRGRAR